jgi:biopolymer transport protein ExbD
MPAPKLLVEVHSGGRFVIEGQTVDASQITEAVRVREPVKLVVTIAGSQDASLQEVMTVIDAVKLGGATQVGLAARQKPR